ncbi:thioesterase II family protein [Amycolatopsis cihanbeyliensis]|uniref:Surfactin synthase thioesterase subunit n=1 Tax=Amycolatopsis cihanbeyliensis TaxID=1128664 RepID=A0A542DEA8_AMYCI|nr:alpha/beta fold hydrolase [Amycolatopsis cihanbeyliensis]TQJ01376.1 surfactin synthase thioesterase subunit [Amycolatopsis cihanbeyliensis]
MTRASGSTVLRPLPRPDAERVLVCLGYSGGGTATFRPWASVLPEDVELAIVCYPGREGRFTTPFARSWDELMVDVLASVRPLTTRPYMLLGHSLGAWVAFEAASRLERAGTAPESLVVSASESPIDCQANPYPRTPCPENTDEELLAWMRDAGQLPEVIHSDPDLREIAVELLRADMRVSRSYRYRHGTTVSAPMQVLYGEDDSSVGAEDAERWRLVSSGPFQITRMPGGHFYTDDIWARLPEQIDIQGNLVK